MGGTQFSVIAELVGTIEATFQSLKEQAAWEYGHAGYTGTIAEKTCWKRYAVVPDLKAAKRLVAEFFQKNQYEEEIGSKWGPAGVIEFKETGKTMLFFFGWASC